MVKTAREQVCGVQRALGLIGDRWSLLIVRDLLQGKRRFCELERSLTGISTKTLSERLKMLEHESLVTRHTFAEIPPRVEYALTRHGQTLTKIVDDLRDWGSKLPAHRTA